MGHFPTKYEIKLDVYVEISIYVYVSCKNDLQNYMGFVKVYRDG